MDIYIKHAVIHQFSPDDTELKLADKPLNITPKIEEYLRKKIERIYSVQAKTGTLEDDSPFWDLMSDDFLTSAVKLAGAWKEEFSVSENLKTNDLIFVQFDKSATPHFAFLRLALRENLAHLGLEDDNPIKITQNNLPGAGSPPDEGFSVNLIDKKYHLIEKRIKFNGAFYNYFSENILQATPSHSAQKSIKTLEQTAQKIASSLNHDDFQFQAKVKSTIFNQLEEANTLSPEKLADKLFDDNLTARLNFIDQVKESVPNPIVLDDIDTTRQIKKFENQKLSLSNGIELIVPNQVYEDAETVEFIQNDDGTYSILIKNIQDIKSK